MSIHEHPSNTIRRTATRRTSRVTVAQLFLRAVQRWQRSRAITALNCLDDRQLEDIGIARNDIPRVAEGLFKPAGRGETESSVEVSSPANGQRWEAA